MHRGEGEHDGHHLERHGRHAERVNPAGESHSSPAHTYHTLSSRNAAMLSHRTHMPILVIILYGCSIAYAT
jgi:hypothetical protein